MWYVYKKASNQTVGPVDAAQVQQWLKDGAVQPDDLMAAVPTGPWLPVQHVLATSFGAIPPGPSTDMPTQAKQTTAGLPPSAPRSKMPGRTLTIDPEFLRRQRSRSRQRARRATKWLLIGAAGLFVIFIGVLIGPFAGRRSSVGSGKTVGKAPMLEDPAVKVAEHASGDIGDLAELIGSKTVAGDDRTRRSGISADQAATGLFAQAASAFGGTVQKVRDSQRNVEIRIEGVQVGYPRLQAGQHTFRTRSPYLMIKVRVTNLDQQQSVTYTPCHGAKTTARLTWGGEPQGLQPFQRRGFLIDGQQAGAIRLDPGKEAMDLYVFAVPPSSVASVTFTIPGQAVGEAKDFVFVLPIAGLLGDRQQQQQAMSPTASEAESGEESTIGPLTPQEGVRGQQGEREPHLEREGLMEEEAIPIPGVHNQGDTETQQPRGTVVSDEELSQREEQARRIAEQLQESLDRDRERARSPSSARERRSR